MENLEKEFYYLKYLNIYNKLNETDTRRVIKDLKSYMQNFFGTDYEEWSNLGAGDESLPYYIITKIEMDNNIKTGPLKKSLTQYRYENNENKKSIILGNMNTLFEKIKNYNKKLQEDKNKIQNKENKDKKDEEELQKIEEKLNNSNIEEI